jgi:type I restriction enzyme M protein
MNASTLVAKVWNYAHVLRDDGVGYGDYVEQITCLLFLKMDEEMVDLLGDASRIPAAWCWDRLKKLEGEALEKQYARTLEALGREKGLLGLIFRKATNKIQDPAKLRRVVSMIDGETWAGLSLDVKGGIYEGLLERNASEVKSGAGQYFTPRPLIHAVVDCLQPRLKEIIHDPACGTGGFLLAAYDFIKKAETEAKGLDKRAADRLKTRTFSGVDVVDGVVRLCAMNLFLHGVGGDPPPVETGDALAQPPKERFDVVLTNPPFGKKSSYAVVAEDGAIARERIDYERADFIATTSNKQLNFLQHIMASLKPGTGRAAVVLPDNVLFEGGAGEKVRRRLLDAFDFHTMIRLPTGIWYSPGVKANVLFFDARPAATTAQTRELWIYDFRTNQHFTLKQNPLADGHLKDFVRSYGGRERRGRKESERFRKFAYKDLVARDKLNLDIFWLKDDSLTDAENLPAPEVLADEIVETLEAALEEFRAVAETLKNRPGR